jgi:hypothetical protein
MAELPNRLQVGTSFDEAMPLLNNMMDELDGENRTKIIYNGTVPQVLFGYQKGGFVDSLGNSVDYGLKVSRIDQSTGIPYDVTTATDEQLQFTTAVDTRLMYNQHVPQLLFGYQNGGFAGQNYGLKISKIDPGTGKPYDIRTATDDQLAFSSAFDGFKIVKSGTQAITPTNVAGDSQIFTIPHGLPYVPLAVAWYSQDVSPDPTIYRQLPDVVITGTITTGACQMDWTLDITTDATNIYVNWFSPIGAGTPMTVRWYLLRETVAAG